MSSNNIGSSQENPMAIVDSDDDMMIDELQETSFYSTENDNTFYSMLSDSYDDIFSGESEHSDDDIDDIYFEKSEEIKYKLNFASRGCDELRIMQSNTIYQISSLLAITKQTSSVLLHFFGWNKEKLIEKYIETPDKVLAEAGLLVSSANVNQNKPQNDSFECEICYNDEPGLQTVGLSCDHIFCIDCYLHYLSEKIKQGDSINIQCPQEGCKMTVGKATLSTVLNQEMYNRYQDLLDEIYVQDNPNLKWCTAPDCKFAIECDILKTSLSIIVPTVTCKCGHTMCFGCDYDNHKPANCAMVKDWWKKKEEDSATASWISSHTKDCPKCQTSIEKNGGCNHMWCKQCKHEFCWVCLGSWKVHTGQAYNCNRYIEDASGLSKKRASLERYLHYWTRYTNHQNSAKLDQELYEKTEESMLQVQSTSDLTWIEVQFLKRAVDTIVQSRNTLKWSYVFAYYMEKTNLKTIFEDNQRDLELATEQLSGMMKTPIYSESIADLRKLVLNKTVYVGRRRETVIDDTAKGLQEGRWEFKGSDDL